MQTDDEDYRGMQRGPPGSGPPAGGPPFIGPPFGAGMVPQGGAQGAQGSGSGRGPDQTGSFSGPLNAERDKPKLPSGTAQPGQGPGPGGGEGAVGELQKGILTEGAGAEKVR